MTIKKKEPNRGKPTNLYLRPEDLQRTRRLASWLMTQGESGYDVSNSQVLRACLRLARAGEPLLKAFLAVAGTDGRRK